MILIINELIKTCKKKIYRKDVVSRVNHAKQMTDRNITLFKYRKYLPEYI